MSTESLDNLCSGLQDSGGSLTADDEMAVVKQVGRIGVRRDLGGESIITARCLANDVPIINNEFVTVRSLMIIQRSATTLTCIPIYKSNQLTVLPSGSSLITP